MKKREKISKKFVLVFGKVKQNSDGEVRILLGKWSNLLGKWSNLLGRWSNLLGKWSKFDGEMKQNDGQMKQNLMGRCPIDKVHTTHIDQGMSVISSIGTEAVARLGETLHGMWVCVPGTRCQVSVSVYQVPASSEGEPGRCLECAGAVRWMRQRGSIEKNSKQIASLPTR